MPVYVTIKVMAKIVNTYRFEKAMLPLGFAEMVSKVNFNLHIPLTFRSETLTLRDPINS